MVSCGALGCTIRADKNSNIITLATTRRMLLLLYHGIFRILAYLKLETY